MKDIINVKDGDILWWFYCKWFSIQGREVIAPKNLCLYFWTAVYGFGLWLGREVRLLRLWGLVILAIAISSVLIASDLLIDNSVGSLIWSVILLICFLVLLVAMAISGYRFLSFIEARAKWVPQILMLLLSIWVISSLAIKGTLWTELKRIAIEIYGVFKYGFAFVALVIVLAFIIYKLPGRQFERIQSAFETFGEYLKARKNKVCPPVNPPPGFKKTET